jgi:polar amino acid transport system substrate-binding protein
MIGSGRMAGQERLGYAVRYRISTAVACLLRAFGLLCIGMQLAQACPAVTRVGISELGFASSKSGEQYEGISVDLIRELGRRTGCKVDFMWFPRDRLLFEYSADRVDIAMAALRTPQLDKLARFLPYGYTEFELIVPRRAGSIASLNDFIEKSSATLVAHRGQTFTPAIKAQLARLDKAGRLELTSDFESIFKRVNASQGDATIATPVVSMWYRKRLGKADEMAAMEIQESGRQMVGMYLSRKNLAAGEREAFAAAMRAIIEDGTLLRIYGAYLDAPTVRRLFRDDLKQLAAATAIP